MVTTLAVVEADGAVDGAVVHRAGVGLAEEAGEVGARVGAALGGDFDGGVGGGVGDSVVGDVGGGVGLAVGAEEVGASVGAALGGDVGGGVGGGVGDSVSGGVIGGVGLAEGQLAPSATSASQELRESLSSCLSGQNKAMGNGPENGLSPMEKRPRAVSESNTPSGSVVRSLL